MFFCTTVLRAFSAIPPSARRPRLVTDCFDHAGADLGFFLTAVDILNNFSSKLPWGKRVLQSSCFHSGFLKENWDLGVTRLQENHFPGYLLENEIQGSPDCFF